MSVNPVGGKRAIFSLIFSKPYTPADRIIRCAEKVFELPGSNDAVNV